MTDATEKIIEKIEAIIRDPSHSSLRAKALDIHDYVFSVRKFRHEKFDIDVYNITDGYQKLKKPNEANSI